MYNTHRSIALLEITSKTNSQPIHENDAVTEGINYTSELPSDRKRGHKVERTTKSKLKASPILNDEDVNKGRG